ncbi:single-stranded-DNA-specific exonuclease RecJ [Moraxella boevrei]|uniref:single-stranded-DNA-specific exonuclease RecJ n=1 Tax=Faucicola boevrei TaxID=346665 RepID=UPI00373605D3
MLKLTPRLDNNEFLQKLPTTFQQLAPLAEQSMTLARILAGRGVLAPNELDTALGALLPANQLLDIDNAVALLNQAIDNQQKILIIGDFDCDGATSTALMVRVLREMGANVEFLVPYRFKYGYGLTPEIVDLGVESYQPDMIVTVDNGISSHAGVERAKQYGLTVVITDHHLTNKVKPNANAVVNPNQLGCAFASKSLVGVGVAFYVLGSLAKIRREQQKPTTHVSKYLDLVALGTIADVGVLDQNNRILVHHGLMAIREGRCCLGILALLEQASKQPSEITAQDFGFIIGPRINAAGRMDNMQTGIECLLSDDWQQATELASELNQLNLERRQVEQGMREQADIILQNKHLDSQDSDSLTNASHKRSIILYQDNWHQGVIGIVAGRLKERYHLPAIVFAPADTSAVSDSDLIKGSARSIAGVHIRDMIETVAQRHPELITHFGGHAMAAGLSIEKHHFSAFCQAFENVLSKLDADVFEETLLTDGQLLAQDFNTQFVYFLNNLTVWGHGFVPPIFDGVFVVQDFRVLKQRHVKLWLSHPDVTFTIEAIWFNADFEAFNPNDIEPSVSQAHLLFSLDNNEFNGQVKLQLLIKKAVLV